MAQGVTSICVVLFTARCESSALKSNSENYGLTCLQCEDIDAMRPKRVVEGDEL